MDIQDPELKQPAGCFVTLWKRNALRGCIGVMAAEKPLAEQMPRMVVSAASRDPRFQPVRVEELGDIRMELSILSSMEAISSYHEVEVGRHGVSVEWGNRSGVFLPEVATEMKWNAETFVKACLVEKAGIPESAWPETKLYRFTTEKIREQE